MGEWSKKVGEVGENIVQEFLSIIGWSDAQKGIELPCALQKHNKSTHGIDYFLSLESQLIHRTLDHLVISVKFTSAPYPSSPATKFKEHFSDLAKTTECFKKSQLRKDSNSTASSVDQSRDIGVLFWLTNDGNSYTDVISKVATTRRIEDYNYDVIYLVDDNRISFIYDTMTYLKSTYPDSKLEFFYPNTGQNYSPSSRETSGPVLPVEYINASILPLKLTKPDGAKSLVLSSVEEFHRDRLKKLIGLAQDISLDLTSGTLILFPDFNTLNHSNDVQSSKSGFRDKDFTKTITVSCYRDDFRGLGNA